MTGKPVRVIGGFVLISLTGPKNVTQFPLFFISRCGLKFIVTSWKSFFLPNAIINLASFSAHKTPNLLWRAYSDIIPWNPSLSRVYKTEWRRAAGSNCVSTSQQCSGNNSIDNLLIREVGTREPPANWRNTLDQTINLNHNFPFPSLPGAHQPWDYIVYIAPNN